MYERRHDTLLPRSAFVLRVVRHVGLALGLIAASLGVGVWGYHALEGLSWIDSLLNAAMILGGMGPVAEMRTAGGKLFASVYALYSGMFFLAVAGVVFAPLFHRFLHRFHLEVMDDDQPG